ncbi:MAG: hypothetical protein OXC63_01395 [Aestuariivita sp.]|nr:hypothetical protein [Aestuariivita sp.]MCY4345610.1 hypothetical protein [Aestuariivita sp.]
MSRENNTETIKPVRVHIPVEHIHETVMPPYKYQKTENGFGILHVKDKNPPFAPDASDESNDP